MAPTSRQSPVAIVAGGGRLPIDLAASLKRAGRGPVVFAIDGEAAPEIREFKPYWIGWGHIGRILTLLKQHQCRDLVLIGSITRRPDYRSVVGDLGTLKRLPRILAALVGGDNTVLEGVIGLIEQDGFRVVGAHELAPDLLAPPGTLTKIKPSRKTMKDAEFGLLAVHRLGEFDIGQSVVVIGRRIAAVEAAEGTDDMLARIATLREAGRIYRKTGEGVFVKATKPGQDLRVDLPTIGPDTIDRVHKAGLAGLVIEANRVLIAERDRVIDRANALGLFLHGIASGGHSSGEPGQ